MAKVDMLSRGEKRASSTDLSCERPTELQLQRSLHFQITKCKSQTLLHVGRKLPEMPATELRFWDDEEKSQHNKFECPILCSNHAR